MIVRKYPMNEKVTYLQTIRPYSSDHPVSYTSGNIFESLATTNPEAFNSTKLQTILVSKNIVEEFTNYLVSIMNEDYNKFYDFIKKYEKSDNKTSMNDEFYRDFNVSRYGIIACDLEYLHKILKEDQITAALFNAYIPEGLEPDVIKKIIRIRLVNDQILINGLMTMIDRNYELFNLNICEAQGLLNKLSNGKSNEAIGDIRNIFKNPEVLEKFRDKMGNFDFRPIGGAYVIVRDKLELQGFHPSKYMQNIFKYDCIVGTHGGYNRTERRGILGTLFNPKFNIIQNCYYLLNYMYHNKYFNDVANDKVKKMVFNALNELSTLKNELYITMKDLDYVYEIFSKIADELVINAKQYSNSEMDKASIIYNFYAYIDCYMQPISDKHNIMRNLKDGRSGSWTIQPVNTQTEKNVTHVIDLIRILKKEGFKNILITACNPGSVRLPIDIRMDKTFNVTMGLHSVLIESQLDDIDYISENFIDSITYTVRGLLRNINTIISKCRTRLNEINKGISSQIKKKFGTNTTSFNKINASIIKFDGRYVSYDEKIIKSPKDFEDTIIDANKSLMKAIENIQSNQEKFIRNIGIDYDRNNIFDQV